MSYLAWPDCNSAQPPLAAAATAAGQFKPAPLPSPSLRKQAGPILAGKDPELAETGGSIDAMDLLVLAHRLLQDVERGVSPASGWQRRQLLAVGSSGGGGRGGSQSCCMWQLAGLLRQQGQQWPWFW